MKEPDESFGIGSSPRMMLQDWIHAGVNAIALVGPGPVAQIVATRSRSRERESGWTGQARRPERKAPDVGIGQRQDRSWGTT